MWGVCFCVFITGEICRARKVFFHTDAAQAIGKIPMDVNDMKIDLMSISGHKIYGPKGTYWSAFLESCCFHACLKVTMQGMNSNLSVLVTVT